MLQEHPPEWPFIDTLVRTSVVFLILVTFQAAFEESADNWDFLGFGFFWTHGFSAVKTIMSRLVQALFLWTVQPLGFQEKHRTMEYVYDFSLSF